MEVSADGFITLLASNERGNLEDWAILEFHLDRSLGLVCLCNQ